MSGGLCVAEWERCVGPGPGRCCRLCPSKPRGSILRRPELSGRHAQFLALSGGVPLRHPLGLNDRKRQHDNRDALMN